MTTPPIGQVYRRVSATEFLAMDFGGAKAELVDGAIFMMAGGSEAHARVAQNISAYMRVALRGTGCRPYNSDFAARTEDQTVRFPDVSVYCGNPSAPGNERKQLLGDPQVVVEVLSPSTARYDHRIKVEEYKALPGTREIVLVDPDTERVRLVWRTERGWRDEWLDAGADVSLPSLNLSIPHAEIFARD